MNSDFFFFWYFIIYTKKEVKKDFSEFQVYTIAPRNVSETTEEANIS